jgi:N-acetylmuramoyl-L-alanine amidase
MDVLRRGTTGSAVADVRRMLAMLGLLANTDPSSSDVFDEATEFAVRHFQQSRGISVDGAIGSETYAVLTGAHWRLGDRVLAHSAGQPIFGDDVSALQVQLLELGYNVTRADGIFAAGTADGLRAFQRDYGLVADGVCGPKTLRALLQLRRRVVGQRCRVWTKPAGQADRHRPGTRRRRSGCGLRRDHRGRLGVGPRHPTRGKAERPGRHRLDDAWT